MSITSSINAFIRILKEDRKLSELGVPRGTLVRFHYFGRFEERSGRLPRLKRLNFQFRQRKIDLELAAPYLGAFKGIFLDKEYDCSSFVEQPIARVMDLGANIGMGTISLASQFPQADFMCVEPDPRNIELLDRNLKANLIRAVVASSAIGSESGTLKLRFGNNPTCSALQSSPMHDLMNVIEVSVKSVPELMEENGWDWIDIMKIDIEGSERDLLGKNNEWLKHVKYIVLEIHPNTSEQEIGGFLKPFGFELKRICFATEPVYFASRRPEVYL